MADENQCCEKNGVRVWWLDKAGQSPTLLEALLKAGVKVPALCNGAGKCGKCQVKLAHDANVSEPCTAEADLLGSARLAQGLRLACCTSASGPVELAEAWIEESKIDQATDSKALVQCDCEAKPAVIRRIVEPWPPSLGDGWSLDQCFSSRWDKGVVTSLGLLRQLGRIEPEDGAVTFINNKLTGASGVVAGRKTESLGLAVDLGTTSIAAYLCDLNAGRVLDAGTTSNPQAVRGADVISRLGFADCGPECLAELATAARNAVNGLMDNLLRRSGLCVNSLDEMTLAGNTAMIHIFLDVPVKSLTMFPFTRVLGRHLDVTADELGLDTGQWVNLHVLPSVAGFLGGDIVAAVLAARHQYSPRPLLVIDLGTNGEIALVTDQGIAAASCAIGPALEGAQISCGMRAVAGAINKVQPGAIEGFAVDWIGREQGESVHGVCGAGLIEAAAVMRTMGMLDASGRLLPNAPGVRNGENGTEAVLCHDPDTGSEITLTQQDIRQLQLAKAALNVGIESLMSAMDVDQVEISILTGAFGAGFDYKSAQAIGMLPGPEAGEIVTMNNAAGLGALMALINTGYREMAAELARQIRHVDLVQDQTLAERFAMSTMFPEILGK